jgi:prepilin-type N-terminal cleavage/methylation domain-containing protein
MKKNDEGFTLIELLIVIVILGILATVVVFAVGGITNRGKASACVTDRSTLEVAIEAYNAQYGVYPTTETQLVPAFMRSGSQKYDISGTAGALAVTPTGTAEGCTT